MNIHLLFLIIVLVVSVVARPDREKGKHTRPEVHLNVHRSERARDDIDTEPSAEMSESIKKWPHLVGIKADEAEAEVQRDRPDIVVKRVPKVMSTKHSCGNLPG